MSETNLPPLTESMRQTRNREPKYDWHNLEAGVYPRALMSRDYATSAQEHPGLENVANYFRERYQLSANAERTINDYQFTQPVRAVPFESLDHGNRGLLRDFAHSLNEHRSPEYAVELSESVDAVLQLMAADTIGADGTTHVLTAQPERQPDGSMLQAMFIIQRSWGSRHVEGNVVFFSNVRNQHLPNITLIPLQLLTGPLADIGFGFRSEDTQPAEATPQQFLRFRRRMAQEMPGTPDPNTPPDRNAFEGYDREGLLREMLLKLEHQGLLELVRRTGSQEIEGIRFYHATSQEAYEEIQADQRLYSPHALEARRRTIRPGWGRAGDEESVGFKSIYLATNLKKAQEIGQFVFKENYQVVSVVVPLNGSLTKLMTRLGSDEDTTQHYSLRESLSAGTLRYEDTDLQGLKIEV